jgi:hypothetical protein
VITRRGGNDQQMFAEVGFLAFAGSPQTPEWLAPDIGEQLLDIAPEVISQPIARGTSCRK